jgi:hypothetical protein
LLPAGECRLTGGICRWLMPTANPAFRLLHGAFPFKKKFDNAIPVV